MGWTALFADAGDTIAQAGGWDWSTLLERHGLTALFAAMLLKYGPKLVAAHLDFLKATKGQGDTHGQILAKLVEAVAVKLDAKGDPRYRDHLFSTVHTNEAIGHLVDAGQAAADAHSKEAGDAVRPHLSAAKQAALHGG